MGQHTAEAPPPLLTNLNPNSGSSIRVQSPLSPDVGLSGVTSRWSPPLAFGGQKTSPDESLIQHPGPKSSESGCWSLRSNQSMKTPLTFGNHRTFPDRSLVEDEGAAAGGDQTTKEQQTCLDSKQMDHHLLEKRRASVCEQRLRTRLKTNVQSVLEGVAHAGSSPLHETYTELHITEGGPGELGEEHEFRQIEVATRRADRPERTIREKDFFQATPEKPEPIRTVLTKGVAGIGKTSLTQKFTLDWAEGRTSQKIQFLLPFTFRELNVLRGRKFSLVGLVHHFFVETKEAGISAFDPFQVLFIFDGLDECRLPLDFRNNPVLSEVTEASVVEVLLTNLISGKLLPSARIWITSRPAAASQVPAEFVDLVTEVRGFADPQKEEYFRRRFRGEEQTERILSHIRTSRSLHVMCHIPVFCWVTATVLEDVLRSREAGELPRSLTEMYVHYLVVQTKQKKRKYDGGTKADPHWTEQNREMVESLAKLAFEQLQKGNLIFYECDLTECGINISAASWYSGVFTQIFKKETALHQDKMFSFVHLSVQEFLAALHVHQTFINSGVNLLKETQTSFLSRQFSKRFIKPNLHHLHKYAVDAALQSPNGHLDLFLRFLLGLSLQTNQKLLQGLLTEGGSSSQSNQETLMHIHKKITEEELSTEKSINLFHCLNELNDDSLLKKIQEVLTSGHLHAEKLSSAQFQALVFLLLSSEEDLDVFDVQKFSSLEDVLLRLMPVVKASSKAVLSFCSLTERSCEALASVLTSRFCSLRDLDLSNNGLQESGLELLWGGLQSPNCVLETLRLSGCLLSEKSLQCFHLQTRLRDLDLSNNPLQASVQLLSAGLRGPQCHLETLRLQCCGLSGESCELLSAVLSSSSSLTDLDLSNNDLLDAGVKHLSAALKTLDCRLESLRLSGCQVSEEGCVCLDAALSSNPSHLKELDLSYNYPGDLGTKLLSAKREDPNCKLEALRLEPAGVQWLGPGLKKYVCELSFDPNTVHKNLKLSEDQRGVTFVEEEQPYPDHPDRFLKSHQLLCGNTLTGRCYWEAELTGGVHVSVSYRGTMRGGEGNHEWFGGNTQSWTLYFSQGSYSVWHNKKGKTVPSSSSSSSSGPHRVALYLDHPAGTLSFYRVSSDMLTHLHTFSTTFTEPLRAGFGLWTWSGLPVASSVRLCSL
uniref:NLR family CARD domain-containing protein 3-like n=1 Tax=Oryzias sinensis TaxID=183150 RepID=A0A8C7YHV4_9TELE